MWTAESLDTHEGWARAHDRRSRCALPECPNERAGDEPLCHACALDAELFDRDARWDQHRARRV